jgi:hypothetical protein
MNDDDHSQIKSYADLVEAQQEAKREELTPGFQSPHDARDFAEKVARGRATQEKMGGAGSLDSIDPLSVVYAHLKTVEKTDEHPLGEDFDKFFYERYGREPYTESYVPETAPTVGPSQAPTGSAGAPVAEQADPSQTRQADPAPHSQEEKPSNPTPSLSDILNRDQEARQGLDSQKPEQGHVRKF